ncbi:MAG: glycosyltransferase [Gammaproteobacteria bacterium]|nr:glycosyltransferase [Gammaproteobacteria bacterium]
MDAEVSAPVISVVMASYNSRRHIAEALDSILRQCFGDFEIIVVDDSSDGAAAIVAAYTDPRIRLIKNQTKTGISNARNQGIAQARGEFIAFHDADDVSLPGRFQKQIDYLTNHPGIAMLGGQVETIDGDGARAKVPLRKLSPDYRDLKEKNCFATSSVMVRRSALQEAGGFHPVIDCAEDWELWIRIAKKHRTANLPDTLFLYRVTPGGITEREQPNLPLWNALVVEIAHGDGAMVSAALALVARDGIAAFVPQSRAARAAYHHECYRREKNARHYNAALQHCIAFHNLHGWAWGNVKNLAKTKLKSLCYRCDD